MDKSREELEKEYAEATAKLEQYQHRGQRYENRIRYYTQGERKKRNHRLITRGGAVESIAPEVRGMSERAFFLLMEKVFSLPEVAALVSQATDQQESGYERVKDNTVDAGTVTLVYEHGTREQPAEQHFNGYPDPQLGKFEYFEVQPKDPEALQSLLREEKHSRDKLTPGDLKEHIAALHEGMIEHEARRIVADMKKLSAPNSPDKSHFMVELSPSFERLASTKDTERLFSMLPYKTLAFSQIKNSYGTYALIGKDENRDKEVRKPRPSVRAQLAQDKKRTVPKKAAAKKKDHGLEV